LALKIVQALDPLADRMEVREQASEPALVHVRHPSLFCHLLDRVLGLLLRANEQDDAAARREVVGELARTLEQHDRLLQIDDVDPVALAEDVAAHLWMPAPRLVAEVQPGLQQLANTYLCHVGSLLSWCCSIHA
jgi:hypothetical protein